MAFRIRNYTVQVWSKAAHVNHVRGGKVARLVLNFDRDRALANLGLSPDPDAAGAADEATGSGPAE